MVREMTLHSVWSLVKYLQISLPKKAAAKFLGFPNILLFGFCWRAIWLYDKRNFQTWRFWKKCLEICPPQPVLIHTWIFQICIKILPKLVGFCWKIPGTNVAHRSRKIQVCVSHHFLVEPPGKVETKGWYLLIGSTPCWLRFLNCPFFLNEIPEKLIHMAWYSPGGTNFNTSYPGDSGKIIDLKVPWFRVPSCSCSLENPHCWSDNAIK